MIKSGLVRTTTLLSTIFFVVLTSASARDLRAMPIDIEISGVINADLGYSFLATDVPMADSLLVCWGSVWSGGSITSRPFAHFAVYATTTSCGPIIKMPYPFPNQ